jgi:hypothetical protein
MSTAFYIVLDNDEPGFDTFVNGKALAKESRKLDAICQKLGIPKFDDFVSMSADDLSEFIGDDAELPKEKWFDAEEGLKFVNALIAHIKVNPKDVKHFKAVSEELAEYADILSKAKSIGAKWHFSIDF